MKSNSTLTLRKQISNIKLLPLLASAVTLARPGVRTLGRAPELLNC